MGTTNAICRFITRTHDSKMLTQIDAERLSRRNRTAVSRLVTCVYKARKHFLRLIKRNRPHHSLRDHIQCYSLCVGIQPGYMAEQTKERTIAVDLSVSTPFVWLVSFPSLSTHVL